MVQDQFDPDFYFKVYHTVAKDGGEQVSLLMMSWV